ncbi:MAG: adenosine kinase [Puniceicoccaceae bacterium]
MNWEQRSMDVYALGNALVDILASVDDAFVEKLGFAKGSMNLVDTAKRTEILKLLQGQPLERKSGGSAANSMIAITQSGGNGIFAGKVAQDAEGQFFRHDLRDGGVTYDVAPGDPGIDPTGTSIILTTPDAERTMCTHLGISIALDAPDVVESQIAQCKLCYIEGYLWSGPSTRAAALRTMQLARKVGTRVSFTFSDSFLVQAFADSFRSEVLPHCDIVFCNRDEALQFTGASNLSDAVRSIGEQVPMAFVTDGAHGAWIAHAGAVTTVAGYPAVAIDTVGAGDAFAGGVLYALARGAQPEMAARWGNALASKVVEVRGPRLQSLPEELKQTVGFDL